MERKAIPFTGGVQCVNQGIEHPRHAVLCTIALTGMWHYCVVVPLRSYVNCSSFARIILKYWRLFLKWASKDCFQFLFSLLLRRHNQCHILK